MNVSGINQIPQSYVPYGRTPQTNGIVWVQGIEGAKAFQMYPNSNSILMDSENDRFYIKTCDNIGMCTLRMFKYEEIAENTPTKADIDLSQFITRDEVLELINENGGMNNVKQTIQSTKQHTANTSTK